MAANAWTWLRPAWLFNRRVAAGALKALLWVLLVGSIAVSVNVAGIHVVGSIDGWQRWLAANRSYFFAWRLLLYAATACGWWATWSTGGRIHCAPCASCATWGRRR